MNKEITIEDLREAFKAGYTRGNHTSYFDKPLDEDEWISEFMKDPEVIEETIPVTLGTIKFICGWSEFCDVTGGNHYMLKEWNVSDREIFDVKISHAEKLNLI